MPIADRSTIVETTAWNAGVASAPAEPDEEREHQDVPELDDAGHRQEREDRGDAGGRQLGRGEQPAQVDPVGEDAGEDREQEDRRGRRGARRAEGDVESVRLRTSQPWAVACIQLPMLPTNAARMNRR